MKRRASKHLMRRREARRLGVESLEVRVLLAADSHEIVSASAPARAAEMQASAWTNTIQPLDVNRDGKILPQDALIVINRLNAGLYGALPIPGLDGPPPYIDVDGDGLLVPLDALLIVNWLNEDVDGPELTAALQNDTGPLPDDGVSTDVAVEGAAIDPSNVVKLLASIGPVSPHFDATTDLAPDGAFVFDEARLAEINGGPIDDGDYTLNLRATDSRGHSSFMTLPFTRDRSAPSVSLSIAPYLDDLTPLVTVAGVDDRGFVMDGMAVIDVDLDGDGDFDDPGEMDYAVGPVYEGVGTFQVTPALPATDPGVGPYGINVRARLVDGAGNEATSEPQGATVDTLTSTVLADYVAADDGAYGYSLSMTNDGDGYTAYLLDMTSQVWRSASEVNRTTWQHWVTVIVPDGPLTETATLVIDGGSTRVNPTFNLDPALIYSALATQSVVVVLPTVPNQPLQFTDEGFTRSEDAIIAYTFDKFLEDPNDTDWPLLLPMTKSAVKAMDAVQDFLPSVLGGETVDDFIVTGGSKRGWTTWLTAAVDDRVRAIAPAVIDVLNLDEQMMHHYGGYGFFSPAIGDYEQAQIFERLLTPEGQALGRIVDPYHYLHAGRYDIPKLILNSAGDEFFLPDSSQFYYDDLPGPKYLRYFPNTGHGLDASAFESLVAFNDAILNDRPLPEYSWELLADGSLRVETVDAPLEVRMWQATNTEARDFRNLFTGIPWTSSTLADEGGGVYVGSVPVPETGATAFFVELVYPSMAIGLDAMPVNHRFTTQVHVRTDQPLYDWPFAAASSAAAAAALAVEPSATASGDDGAAVRDTALRLLTDEDGSATGDGLRLDRAALLAAVLGEDTLGADAPTSAAVHAPAGLYDAGIDERTGGDRGAAAESAADDSPLLALLVGGGSDDSQI